MSRFYGSLEGSARTTATRRGSKASGVSAHVRGWDIGLEVIAHDHNGNDAISVYLTRGSNGEPANEGCELLFGILESGEVRFVGNTLRDAIKGEA